MEAMGTHTHTRAMNITANMNNNDTSFCCAIRERITIWVVGTFLNRDLPSRQKIFCGGGVRFARAPRDTSVRVRARETNYTVQFFLWKKYRLFLCALYFSFPDSAAQWRHLDFFPRFCV